jgi:Domain of unknown function (DUF4276)
VKIYQLLVGFWGEGTSDYAFLIPIIRRTFRSVSLDCHGEIEVLLEPIPKSLGPKRFVDQAEAAAKIGVEEFGMTLLCVHVDADSNSPEKVIREKIQPAKERLSSLGSEQHCSEMLAVIPVQMTESWMMADVDVLKTEIGTTIPNDKLGFHRKPEEIADPKGVINAAIRMVKADGPKKRQADLAISDLYQIMGNKISLEKLAILPSYQHFRAQVEEFFRGKGLLR